MVCKNVQLCMEGCNRDYDNSLLVAIKPTCEVAKSREALFFTSLLALGIDRTICWTHCTIMMAVTQLVEAN